MRNSLIFLFGILPSFLFCQTEVFSEDFESGIPATWTLIDNDQRTVHPSVETFQPAWISTADIVDENNLVAGSTSYFSPEGRASRWLITPPISIAGYGNILEWRAMSHDPSFPDWYMVLISTTGTEIADFTDTLFRIVNEFTYWTEREVNLSDSGYNDQTIHLAFVNNTNRGFKLYLDDVKVFVNSSVSLTSNAPLISVNVYPNPASEFVYIQSEEAITSVKLMDNSGKTIESFDTNVSEIDIRKLHNGTYYIHIETNQGIAIKKIVKIEG